MGSAEEGNSRLHGYIVYGVGVGFVVQQRPLVSLVKLSRPMRGWRRLFPSVNYREMECAGRRGGRESAGSAAGNFFPELFHCSGFAIANDATVGGGSIMGVF